MQNLITLVGLATLANSASLNTNSYSQITAQVEDGGKDKKRNDNDDEPNEVCLSGPLTKFQSFCDPCKKDDPAPICDP